MKRNAKGELGLLHKNEVKKFIPIPIKSKVVEKLNIFNSNNIFPFQATWSTGSNHLFDENVRKSVLFLFLYFKKKSIPKYILWDIFRLSFSFQFNDYPYEPIEPPKTIYELPKNSCQIF